MNKIDLNNKVAIVTGGAQGFGLAITKRFVDSGCRVVIWDKDEKILKNLQLDNIIKIKKLKLILLILTILKMHFLKLWIKLVL